MAKAEPSEKRLPFRQRYQVDEFQAYKCDPDTLVIPPEDHPLYDEDGSDTFDPLRVEEIDKDGVFVGTVIVWADTDRNKLYVVEGRGSVLDIREVNRRRRERKDEPILIRFMPLGMTLDRAVEHVRLRNFHRKVPTLGHIAREIVRLQKLGKPWGRIADILHLVGETEHMLRNRAVLAFCIPDVVEAAEAGKVTMRFAKKMGGRTIDGSEALSTKDQKAALAEMLEKRTAESVEKDKSKSKPKMKARPRAFVEAWRSALCEEGGHDTVVEIIDVLLGAEPSPDFVEVFGEALGKAGWKLPEPKVPKKRGRPKKVKKVEEESEEAA